MDWIKRIRELEKEARSIFNVGLLRPTGLIRTVAALRHDTFEVGVSAIFKSGLRQPAWQVSVLNDYCEGGAAPRASIRAAPANCFPIPLPQSDSGLQPTQNTRHKSRTPAVTFITKLDQAASFIGTKPSLGGFSDLCPLWARRGHE